MLPPPTQLLFRLTELKLRATQLGIRKIELGPRGGRLMFEAEPKVDAERLVRLLQREPQTFRFEGKDKLRVSMDLPDAQARLSALERVLDNLETRDAA
jgi:transcription-repair coupling factor (superfamily II helicase)